MDLISHVVAVTSLDLGGGARSEQIRGGEEKKKKEEGRGISKGKQFRVQVL